MKSFRVVRIAALFCAVGLALSHAQLYWRIDGTSGTLTSSDWSTTGSAPFTSAWVNSSDIVFTANSAITYVTNTPVKNLTVSGNSTVTWTGAGTYSTGGSVVTFDIGTGSTLNWNGQSVSTAAGTGFIKNGGGTWNIGNTMGSGAAPGGFTLNAGTIITSGTHYLGDGPLTINGGTWQSSGTVSYSVSSITIGGDFALSGTGNAVLSAGGVSLGAATRTITNSTTSGSRQLTGVISGSSGAGLVFAGDNSSTDQLYIGNTGNTFSGPVTITGGEVVFNGDGALGTGNSITIDGGRLTMASMNTAGSTSALTSATISSSRNIFVGDTDGTSISIQGGTGVTTYNGVIADVSGKTGSWAKQGGGMLQLGGVSTYSGDTSINNGTIQLTTGSNRLPTGTTVYLGQAASTNLGTLDLNGQNQQIAGLNSTAGTNSGASKNTVTSSTAATLTLGGSGTYSFGDGTAANSGVVTGSIALVKSGSGTQTLGDANTYTGGTIVNAGTLAAGNDLAFGSGSVSVNSGGTLALNGHSLGNAITIASGGIFSGTGTLTGPLTLTAGSIYAWNLASESTTAGSQLTLTSGSLTLTGALLQFAPGSLTPTNDTFWQSSQSWTVVTTTSGYITGSFSLSSINQTSWNDLGAFSVSGQDLDWTASFGVPGPTGAIPEPATYVAIAGMAALAFAAWKRRQKPAVVADKV